jgi:hypothetical protein
LRRFKLSALAGLIGAGLVAGAAPHAVHAAQSDEAAQMAAFFKSTLEIRTAAGDWSAERYMEADHTYRERGSDGELRGAWRIENGKICTTPGKPLGDDRAATYCNIGLGKKVGDAWNDQDPVTGATVMFKLKPGR